MNKPRLLVVEDERVIAREIAASLTMLGYQVTACAASAVSAMKSIEMERPDLVLMDIKIEGDQDGIETARGIQMRFDIPIIYLTAFSDKEIFEQAKKTAPYGFVNKPASREDLRSAIEVALARHTTDKRIRESEERFRLAFEYGPDAIFWADAETGEILNCNTAGEDLLGRSRSEIIGLNQTELHPPEQQDYWRARFQSHSVSGAIDVEGEVFTAEGHNVPVRITARAATIGGRQIVQGVFRNISERKKIERELEVSEAQKQAILDGITASIMFVNPDLEILWANRAAADFVGELPEHVIGRKCHTLWMDTVEPCHGCPVLAALDTRQGQRAELVRQDGRIWGSGASPVFSDEGTVAGVVCIAKDITDEKKIEELSLQTAKYKAVADLAAGVAHNFNNLLQIALGNAELAALDVQSGAPSAIMAKLEEIIATLEFGSETVKRLNRFVKDSRRQPLTESELFDLSKIVVQVVETSKPLWKEEPEKRGAAVSVSCDLEQGCFVSAKKSDLCEVILNLIKNAVEALPNGGHITIATFHEFGDVIFRIRDTGIGIPSSNVSRLFTPFFSTSVEVGRGLGLATCRTIIDSHGGHILVESTEGEGSTFTVRLPAGSQEQETAEEPEPAKP